MAFVLFYQRFTFDVFGALGLQNWTGIQTVNFREMLRITAYYQDKLRSNDKGINTFLFTFED